MNDKDSGSSQNSTAVKVAVVSALAVIVAALIPVVYNALKDDGEKSPVASQPSSVVQQSDNVTQTTREGHNFNNVAGNITITDSADKE